MSTNMQPFIAGQSEWPHPACLRDDTLMRDVDWSRGRGSGPGGQHRNKVETAIELKHRPTAITARASERRSAADNRAVAIKRLRLNLATQHRIPVPLGEVGSKLWVQRRTAPKRGPGAAPQRWGTFPGRIVVNPNHRDFPALLAEAMDVLNAAMWDPRTAALRLEVSTTQLIRLIANHQPAFTEMNAQRDAASLPPLRAR